MTRHPLTPLERAALWLGAKSAVERDSALLVFGWLCVLAAAQLSLVSP